MTYCALANRINCVYFSAVQKFREMGYEEVDCHKAAIAAMNGQTYEPPVQADRISKLVRHED